MNVLHIAALRNDDENPDLIKLLLHYGVDHQVFCFYKEVRGYIVYTLKLSLYKLLIYMTIR